MSLNRFCDNCHTYMPSGTEYNEVQIVESSGQPVSIKDWCLPCTGLSFDALLFGVRERCVSGCAHTP